jgi:multidrug efflux pump subunit AcrB
VGLQVEPQMEISQVRLKVRREEAARHGLAPGDVARLLETAYKGRRVSVVLDEDRYFDLVVWYDEKARSDPGMIGKTILETPSGRKVALSQVAEVLDTTGPNTVNHERVERRIVVACNVQGRSLGDVVAHQRELARWANWRDAGLPDRVRRPVQGQQEAIRLLVLGLLSVLGVSCCCEVPGLMAAALQVLVNILAAPVR